MLPGDASRLVVYLGCDPSATHPDRTGKIRKHDGVFRGTAGRSGRRRANSSECPRMFQIACDGSSAGVRIRRCVVFVTEYRQGSPSELAVIQRPGLGWSDRVEPERGYFADQAEGRGCKREG
jgi:hypothetical protein